MNIYNYLGSTTIKLDSKFLFVVFMVFGGYEVPELQNA
jgi:hypothetical protein